MHDSATCRLCESIPAEGSRRHWKHQAPAGYWHVIADGPALMTRLPRQAHFVTILSYQLGAPGAPVHYHGPAYFEFDADDPAASLADLRCALGILDSAYDCPLAALRIWHSGGRGYHVTIPPGVFGAEAGHPLLPRLYATMIERLFPPPVAPSLDRSIYSAGQGRMWRLPNRRRENGRYKVPLAAREALHKPYTDLEALAHRPRHGMFWPADEEMTPCHALGQLYQQVRDTLGHSTPQAIPGPAGARIPAGARNATLTSLAGAMRRRGMTAEEVSAALAVVNAGRCDPPLAEAEVRRIAESVGRYAPATAAHRTAGGIRTIDAWAVTAWRR